MTLLDLSTTPQRQWERLRAKVTRKVVEVIKKADGERVQKLSYILGLDNGKGKMEKIISYSQLMDHFDNEISDDLYKFRALIDNQGPLKPTDSNWKGCKCNVLVGWETGEKTYEPLSVLAAVDKKNSNLMQPGMNWIASKNKKSSPKAKGPNGIQTTNKS